MQADGYYNYAYSRAAFINFRLTLDGVLHKNCSTEDWFTKSALQAINMQLPDAYAAGELNQTTAAFCHGFASNKRVWVCNL